jgi:signal transduction histidine kinase
VASRFDVLLALGAGLIQVGGTFLASHHHQTHVHHWDALAGVLLAAGPVALVVRRRWPVAVLAVAFLTTLAYGTIGYGPGPVWAGLIVAFGTAVITGHRRAAQVSLVCGYVLFLWLRAVLGWARGPSAAASLGLLAWLLFLLSVAETIRIRRERAVDAARTREEEARRRASEERLAIAREVHDVVAHHISLINVQASTALHLMEGEPERARAALEAIKAASKDALVDLRSVLGVLRRVDEESPRSPTPGIDRLNDLVATAAAAGLAVEVIVDGTRQQLPPTADVAAYRIVQEALTNVTRHAHAAAVTVRIEYGERDLLVEVDDDGRGSRAARPGEPEGNGTAGNATTGSARVSNATTGNGIAGMRERATVLGGTLQAGPRPEGGFKVRAWLPVEAIE